MLTFLQFLQWGAHVGVSWPKLKIKHEKKGGVNRWRSVLIDHVIIWATHTSQASTNPTHQTLLPLMFPSKSSAAERRFSHSEFQHLTEHILGSFALDRYCVGYQTPDRFWKLFYLDYSRSVMIYDSVIGIIFQRSNFKFIPSDINPGCLNVCATSGVRWATASTAKLIFFSYNESI